jgi:hypothetical protein
LEERAGYDELAASTASSSALLRCPACGLPAPHLLFRRVRERLKVGQKNLEWKFGYKFLRPGFEIFVSLFVALAPAFTDFLFIYLIYFQRQSANRLQPCLCNAGVKI